MQGPIHADTEAFLAHLARAPVSHLVGELVNAVNAAGTASAFHFGAVRLGLPELAEEIQRRRSAFIDDANMRELREDSPVGIWLDKRGASGKHARR